MNESNLKDISRHISGSTWSNPKLRDYMDTLCFDIGPRPPASSAMVEATRYLGELLTHIGATNVRTEPVPVLAWNPQPSSLELVRPRHRYYDSVQMVHSAADTVSGTVVPVANASPEELDRVGNRLAGAIILIRGHEVAGSKYVPFPLEICRMVDRGVAGVIMAAPYVEGCTCIELVSVGHPAPIPVMGIAPGDARELLTFALDGDTYVRLGTSGTSYAAQCANLIAEIGSPAATGDGRIVLSAHLDTFHVNPGALDNLTGVLTVLEIARALAPLRFKFNRTLQIIIYSGEEFGFLGSKAYTAAHHEELDQIHFVFNMDTLWTSTMSGVAVMWSPEMRDVLDHLYKSNLRSMDVRNLFCMSSDYLPFMLEGIPSGRPADFFDSMPPWSHTRLDTPDQVSLDWIRGNAMVHGQMIAGLLTQPLSFPNRRKSKGEVRLLLEQEGVIESMRTFGFDL